MALAKGPPGINPTALRAVPPEGSEFRAVVSTRSIALQAVDRSVMRAVTRIDCRSIVLDDFILDSFTGLCRHLFTVGTFFGGRVFVRRFRLVLGHLLLSFGGFFGRCRFGSLIRCRFFNLFGLFRHSHSPLEASIETVSARRLGQYIPNDCHSQRSSHG